MSQFSGIARITRSLSSKSSMNPTLLLAAIVVPLCLLFGFLGAGTAQLFFLTMAACVVGVALFQIIGFSIFAPYRLDDHRHNENMLLIAQRQARIEQDGNILLTPDTSDIIENPLFNGGAL